MPGASSAPAAQDASGSEAREALRFESAIITCPLGTILDLSATGMRLRPIPTLKFSKGQSLTVELHAPTDALVVEGEVVRLKRNGWFSGLAEVGIRFESADTPTRQQIENLVKFGVSRTAVIDPSVMAAVASENRRQLVAALRLPDHYQTLGISRRASAAEIQNAFRTLARKYHPDMNTDEDAERKFCAINLANRVLSDPEQRAEYDRVTGGIAA